MNVVTFELGRCPLAGPLLGNNPSTNPLLLAHIWRGSGGYGQGSTYWHIDVTYMTFSNIILNKTSFKCSATTSLARAVFKLAFKLALAFVFGNLVN